jgi:S-adenosylmethionine synthetase
MGEVTSNAEIDTEGIIRQTILDIGYDSDDLGFNGHTCQIDIKIHKQSPDIAQGVDTGGAGDQGVVYGFACKDTDEFMPFAINYAHKLTEKLTEVRKNGTLKYLRPDGKAQVSCSYGGRVETVIISAHHAPKVKQEKLRADIIKHIIEPILGKGEYKILVNPTGKFEVGGPAADSGLTGRKIIVDTYGGTAHHGGGAFSGKDPSKVDRSAAYMARYIAKNVVSIGLVHECEIQIAYSIGVAEPVDLQVYAYGGLGSTEVKKFIQNNFDLTPNGIISCLDLKRPIYKQTAQFGHFGKSYLPWEDVNKWGPRKTV